MDCGCGEFGQRRTGGFLPARAARGIEGAAHPRQDAWERRVRGARPTASPKCDEASIPPWSPRSAMANLWGMCDHGLDLEGGVYIGDAVHTGPSHWSFGIRLVYTTEAQ